jgi:signal transduction histidine kinase
MSKISFKTLTIVFLLIFLIPLKTYSQDKVKNVVVFFSYSSTLPAYQNILEGLKSTIGKSTDDPVNLIVEYLDIGRTDNEEYASHLINMYNHKLKDFNVDLLITVGPGLNDVLLKYGNSVLKSKKIINIDLDLPGRINLHDLNVNNGKEILLKFNVSGTLRKAFSMFPDYRNVFVISGASGLDSYFRSLIRQSKNEFEPAYYFKFVSGLSMDSTINFVKKIPPNSIVFVPSYLQDASNVPFSTPEVLNIVSKNSLAPVFTLTDAFSKKQGGIGGYIFSYTSLGEETGRISGEILNGKSIQSITVNENSFYQHIYDWMELKRWHLTNSNAVPADSIFFNKDNSFFDLYKWYILGLVIFILSQTLLILYLVRLNKRQKVITLQMQMTENMHRELIREDRMAKMTELTASLSHELNQPLNAIQLNVQAGLQFLDTGKLNDKLTRDIFERIARDDNRAGELIKSVRSMMKLELREMGRVDINNVVQETVNIYHSEATNQHIQLRFNSMDRPVYITGDKIQIQQVILNFLVNAARAMRDMIPEKKVIEINQVLDNNMVTVSTRDYGSGIDETIKDNLFEPFITSHESGFGIGLAVCRSIIERHEGEIWAENMPDGGAEFSFRLKLKKDE